MLLETHTACSALPFSGDRRSPGTPPRSTWRGSNTAQRALRWAARLPHGHVPPRGLGTLHPDSQHLRSCCMWLLPLIVKYRPWKCGCSQEPCGHEAADEEKGRELLPSVRHKAGL